MFNLSIRRALVISSLFVGAATLLATPTKVMADTVTLAGNVAPILNMVTTPTTGANSAAALPLDTTDEQTITVANLDITTNNEQGYTVTATPQNGSVLHKTGGTDIAYTVNLAAVGTNDGGTDSDSAVNKYKADGETASDAVALSIIYTPAALQDPGDYSGSISVTVADN
jgi:hypothetical protein